MNNFTNQNKNSQNYNNQNHMNSNMHPRINHNMQNQRHPQMNHNMQNQIHPQMNPNMQNQIHPQMNPNMQNQRHLHMNPNMQNQRQQQIHPQMNPNMQNQRQPQMHNQMNPNMQNQRQPQMHPQMNPNMQHSQHHRQPQMNQSQMNQSQINQQIQHPRQPQMTHNMQQTQTNQHNNLLNKYNYHKTTAVNDKMKVLNSNNTFLQSNNQVCDLLREIHKYNELKNMEYGGKNNLLNSSKEMDIEKLRDIVIKPQTSKINKEEIKKVDDNYKKIKENYIDYKIIKKNNQKIKIPLKLIKLWKTRTNDPYKSVLKNANILNNDDYKKDYKKEDDLIIHKVSREDKDIELLETNFKTIQNEIEKHNDELKLIYSINEKTKKKKEFEYNLKYKYQYKPSDTADKKEHEDIKQERIEYYKNKQKEEDDTRTKIDRILEKLSNDNITIDNDDSIDKLDQQLKEEFGEDYNKYIENMEMIDENEEKEEPQEELKKKKRKGHRRNRNRG